MPTVSIFIRKDDLPKWKALDKKSEFIHNALINDNVHNIVIDEDLKVIDACKHGADPKFCRFAKNNKPCK